MKRFLVFLLVATGCGGVGLVAQPFRLPTANHALFDPGGEERFFVGTVGKPWTSGTFGCVRSDGLQLHEGLDIRCLQRDGRGEPADPVLAIADGVVVYFNTKPALSNYGKYLVLRHQVEGLEIYSLYAHLSEIRPSLALGQSVHTGEVIARMGRTTNTRQGISRERAHVHFELNLLVNDRFAPWFRVRHPGERNDHGEWNGHNLLGFDPAQLLRSEATLGPKFSLVEHLRAGKELCRVFVRRTSFPWLRRYGTLVMPNPRAEKEGVAGYELALDFNGIAFQMIPRAASEVRGTTRFQLLSVNAAEAEAHGCRHLVVRRGNHWELGPKGEDLLDLLTF